MGFSGETAEIIPGSLGLTGNKNAAQVTIGYLLEALNVTYESGTIRKEGGSSKYNSTVISGAPTVLGGHDWFPSDVVQRMIVLLSDGTVKKDSGGGTFPTTLVSALTVTDVVPVFIDGGQEQAANNRKLFMFTGKNAVQVLSGDGATMAALSLPPADWTTIKPPTGAIHENRLWGAAGHRLYASLSTNHEDFTTTPFSLLVYPGEGDKIVALLSFKGLLIIFKSPKGIYAVDTSSVSTTDWRPFKISRDVGTSSPRGVVHTDDDIVFLSSVGDLHLLSAVQEFGDIRNSSLSLQDKMDEFVRSNINLSKLQFSQMIYYEEKNEIHVTMSKTSSTARDARLVLDTSNPSKRRFRFSDKDRNESLWVRRDAQGIERPVSGDNAGFVWLLDRDARNKDGMGYTGQFQTSHMDFKELDPKLGTVRKIGKFLELVAEPVGNNISVDVLWDNIFTHAIQFSFGSSGAVLGAFILGVDKLSGEAGIVSKRKRLLGSGKRLSLIVRNTVANQDFSVIKFYVHFKRGAERGARS
ncbi:MAG: hypothetical protein L0Y56_04260 [Nitrospira sp.]|nr:hypothetical protein [Nitrospira sp.]